MKNPIFRSLAELALAFCLLSWPGRVAAQSPAQSQNKAAKSSDSSQPATASKASSQLTEQEIRGEGIFLQRCSLCHLPKVVKPYKSFGPSLTGILKGANPTREKTIRLFISTGVPDKMPGFQYALSADDFNDLIAYLKTL